MTLFGLTNCLKNLQLCLKTFDIILGFRKAIQTKIILIINAFISLSLNQTFHILTPRGIHLFLAWFHSTFELLYLYFKYIYLIIYYRYLLFDYKFNILE